MQGAKDSRISKDFILDSIGNDRISAQIAIFEKYLQMSGVYNLVKSGDDFVNPLREDTFPTCTFRLYDNKDGAKVWFRDWADVRGYDCFDLVQKMAACSFTDSLELVAHHFSLLSAERTAELKYVLSPVQIKQLTVKRMEQIDIQIKREDWTEAHKAYWRQYGLSGEDVAYDTTPIKAYWIDGNKYTPPKNLGFCYYFPDGGLKLYFPLADRSKKERKFIHNKGTTVQGNAQLTFTAKYLIITSSNKDVKVIRKLARMYPDLDIEVVAPMSETTPIPKQKIDEYNSKYQLLITYYNNDKQGLESTKAHNDLYGCVGFVNDSYMGKDPSDFIKDNPNNYEKLYEFIKKKIEDLLNLPPF